MIPVIDKDTMLTLGSLMDENNYSNVYVQYNTYSDDNGQVKTIKDVLLHLNLFNCTSLCPVLSSFIGLGRILYGITKLIYEVAMAEFKKENSDEHKRKAKFAAKQLCRGAIEIIPVTGNFIMMISIEGKKREIQDKIGTEVFMDDKNKENVFLYKPDGTILQKYSHEKSCRLLQKLCEKVIYNKTEVYFSALKDPNHYAWSWIKDEK